MSKNTIKDLAVAIVEKHSLNQPDADKFVDALFKLILEALDTDKIVKVKGLGTFKIVEVQDRESVNVNTGERVVIEGHGKVNFTPDNSIKDLVNRPFSQFETVVVNDGVDFTEIENEENDNDAAIIDQIDDNVFAAVAVKETKVEEKKDVIEEKPEEEKIEKKISEEPICEFQNEKIEDEPVVEPKEEEKKNESHKQKNEKESTEVVASELKSTEEPFELVDFSETEVNSAPEELTPEESISEEFSEKKNIVKIILCIVAAIILFVAGYFVGQYFPMNNFLNREVKVPVLGKAANKSVKQQTAIKKPVKQLLAKPIKKSEEKQTSNQPVSSELSSDIYDKKNAQVRTGAYRIIGLSQVITLKSDESLKNISDRILGPGMECYIIAYNDLDGTSTIKKGQKIKIPKIELRRHKSR